MTTPLPIHQPSLSCKKAPRYYGVCLGLAIIVTGSVFGGILAFGGLLVGGMILAATIRFSSSEEPDYKLLRTNFCFKIRQKSSFRCRVCICCLLAILLVSWMLVFRFLADEFGYRPRKVPSRFSQQENTDLLTVFLIDGLRADVFEEELEAGNLPSLSKLAGSGCRVNSVMTAFPSITGYAYWPLQTGIDATRSGHLGTRYFDRRVDVGNWRNHYGPAGVQFEPNFEPQVNTLFEASSDGWTLAGNSMLHRGANVTYTPSLEQYFTKIQHKWWLPKLLRKLPVLRWLVPDFSEYEQRFMRRILNLLQQGQPRVAWIVFGSPDNVAHALGVHDEYRRVLRAIDEAIGQYIKAVRSPSSKYTSLTFAVISDHGEVSVDMDAGGNLNLCDAFTNKGIKAWRGDAKHWNNKFDEPLESFGADKELLIGIQGDSMASVYVKSKEGWKSRTFEEELRSYQNSENTEAVDLVQTALEFQGVELVAWSRQNGVVAVQTTASSGVGLIALEQDGRISYRVERLNNSSRCPLGYNKTLADGKPRSAREWLEATQGSMFPYAVVRLIQTLTTPGLAPDMVVTAADGFDFSKDFEYYIQSFAGGHGGINKNHLRTSAIFSGDGVQSEEAIIDLATAEDIGATLHALLSSPGPSLDFLQGRDNEDLIAAAYHRSSDPVAAQELLQGTPLSCVSSPS